MNETSLDRLNDIVMAEPIAFWPPAPGWYVLAALLFALVMVWGWRSLQRYRANAYRRQALLELAALEASEGTPDLSRVSPLLKRTALTAWPRAAVASLNGEDWHRFLANAVGEEHTDSNWKKSLDLVTYEPHAKLSPQQQSELLGFTRRWIQNHKAEQA